MMIQRYQFVSAYINTIWLLKALTTRKRFDYCDINTIFASFGSYKGHFGHTWF